MRYIPKKSNNEPDSLRATRLTDGATYDECNKNDVREALLNEQGYLCAYCMRRIENERGDNGDGGFFDSIGNWFDGNSATCCSLGNEIMALVATVMMAWIVK